MSQCWAQEENEEGLGGETPKNSAVFGFIPLVQGTLASPGTTAMDWEVAKILQASFSSSPTSPPLHILKFPLQKEKKLSDSYWRNIFFLNSSFKITNPRLYLFYFIIILFT